MNDPAAWDRPVFVSEQRTVTVRNVIEAAHFRGELDLPWKGLIEPFEGQTATDLTDLDSPDEALLQQMSEDYRSARDLITAEETECWLTERGLSLEDFSDYFRRHLCSEHASEENASGRIDYACASPKLRDLVRIELLLGGEFDRMALQLSWRIATLHCSDLEPTSKVIDAERRRFFERLRLDNAHLGQWFERLGWDESRLDEMIALESVYRTYCETLFTTQARERTLRGLRLPLTRLDLETIEVESREAAREAFLCVSEDGLSMAGVATEGRYPYHRAEVVLEDLPAPTQHQILGAAAGEVLEPILQGDGFQLVRLLRKIEPDLSNAEVCHRVEQQILENHFSELAAKCVRWIIPPRSTFQESEKQR